VSVRPYQRPRRHRVAGTAGRARAAKSSGQRAKSRVTRRWLGAAGLGLLVAVFALGPLFAWAHLKGPGGGKLVVVEWPPGLDKDQAAARLEELGLVKSPRLMATYLGFTRSAGHLRAGRHVLNDALSPAALVARLGRRPSRTDVRLTVPEGWNHLQMAARLEEREVCERQEFVAAVRDRQFVAELGVHAETLEGYLFPATYSLQVDSEPREVARTLVGEFRRRMDRLEQERPEALRGGSEHETVILASIVEKETAKADERALVAGVYRNRLTRPDFEPRGRLQSDPTAAYGCVVLGSTIPSCAGFTGRVTPAMLRDSANPYNTYRHAGLPPGPIANPGEASLVAALSPTPTDYLYFVAKGDGGHVFSRTYEEHQQAIRGAR
jgi:UPF0755 protein